MKAQQLFSAEEDGEGFKASEGWLEKFIKLHHFTTGPRRLCARSGYPTTPRSLWTLSYLCQEYARNTTTNETAVWLEDSSGKCIEDKGAKEVSVLTTGYDKMRVMVMLTARSDGFKCKLFVLLPRKCPESRIVEKFKSKLNLSWAGKIWMDDQLTGDYLTRLWAAHCLENAYSCGTRSDKFIHRFVLYLFNFFSPLLLFQAPYVVWNGPFKARIRELYNIWMLNDANKEYTSGRNPRAPSMDVHLEWVCRAWEALPKEMIAKSFKDSGLTNAHHGDEDDQIHCFKPEGPVPEGLQMFQDARFSTEDLLPIKEVDSDEDEENGYANDHSLNEAQLLELEIYCLLFIVC